EATRMTGHRGKRAVYDEILENRSAFPAVVQNESAIWAEPDNVVKSDRAGSPAALLLETIPGASAGATTPGASYYSNIRKYCADTGALWIADEVMTGMGRTGEWFAYQHWNQTPDILRIGKGLAAGYWPISAIVVKASVAQRILELSKMPVGHTYSNHPAGASASHAVIDEI